MKHGGFKTKYGDSTREDKIQDQMIFEVLERKCWAYQQSWARNRIVYQLRMTVLSKSLRR